MRFPLPLLLAPLLLVACSYSKDVPLSANGSEHVLFFSRVTAANLGVVPVGATRTVVVWRSSGGKVECTGLGTGSVAPASAHGGLAPQGGGHPDLPPDKCGSIAPEQVTVESAACDDDACTITSEELGTSVIFRLTSKSKDPTSTRLRVALKNKKDATVWRDSIALSFAPAARVELRGELEDLVPLRLPILAGLKFILPSAQVVDANDKAMSVDEDSLIETIAGHGVIEKNEEPTYTRASLVAKKPGKATVKWELPGAITREVEVEVVERTEARTIALFATPVAQDADLLGLDDLTADTLSPKDALEAIAFTTYSGARSTYATRVRLADGRSALAPLDAVTVEPATLLRPRVSTDGCSLTLSESSSATSTSGTGTVTLEAAGLTQAWPVTVTAGKAQQ